MATSIILRRVGSTALETISTTKLDLCCNTVINKVRHAAINRLGGRLGVAIAIWVCLIPLRAIIAKASDNQRRDVLQQTSDAPNTGLPINTGFIRTSSPKPVYTGFVRRAPQKPVSGEFVRALSQTPVHTGFVPSSQKPVLTGFVKNR